MLHPSKESREEAGLPHWASHLKSLGLGSLAALFVQASRPLAPVLAQLLYIAAPLLPAGKEANSIEGIGSLMEDDQALKKLAGQLQGEKQ